jgi:hypothetical protein
MGHDSDGGWETPECYGGPLRGAYTPVTALKAGPGPPARAGLENAAEAGLDRGVRGLRERRAEFTPAVLRIIPACP